MIDELMYLAQASLIACRDSAQNKERLQCVAEFDFLTGLRTAMDCQDPLSKLESIRSKYRLMSEKLGDVVLKWRDRQYGSIIEPMLTKTGMDCFRSWRLTRDPAIVNIIDLALRNVSDAISSNDLYRVKIETDHVHNLPTHLIPGNRKRLDYYLKVEVQYFLDLIESQYGVRKRLEAISQFEDSWSLLAAKERDLSVDT